MSRPGSLLTDAPGPQPDHYVETAGNAVPVFGAGLAASPQIIEAASLAVDDARMDEMEAVGCIAVADDPLSRESRRKTLHPLANDLQHTFTAITLQQNDVCGEVAPVEDAPVVRVPGARG